MMYRIIGIAYAIKSHLTYNYVGINFTIEKFNNIIECTLNACMYNVVRRFLSFFLNYIQ
jgi:hypothetical protein